MQTEVKCLAEYGLTVSSVSTRTCPWLLVPNLDGRSCFCTNYRKKNCDVSWLFHCLSWRIAFTMVVFSSGLKTGFIKIETLLIFMWKLSFCNLTLHETYRQVRASSAGCSNCGMTGGKGPNGDISLLAQGVKSATCWWKAHCPNPLCHIPPLKGTGKYQWHLVVVTF